MKLTKTKLIYALGACSPVLIAATTISCTNSDQEKTKGNSNDIVDNYVDIMLKLQNIEAQRTFHDLRYKKELLISHINQSISDTKTKINIRFLYLLFPYEYLYKFGTSKLYEKEEIDALDFIHRSINYTYNTYFELILPFLNKILKEANNNKNKTINDIIINPKYKSLLFDSITEFKTKVSEYMWDNLTQLKDIISNIYRFRNMRLVELGLQPLKKIDYNELLSKIDKLLNDAVKWIYDKLNTSLNENTFNLEILNWELFFHFNQAIETFEWSKV